MNKKSNDMSITGKGTPCLIDAERIDYAPWNPRPEITEADVAELAESIRERGLLNRLSVMANPEKEEYFIVFAGNRRYAACRLAGVKAIPCEIFDVTIEEAKVLTALENLQRKDVEPLREAALVKECLDGGMNGEEIAAKVGKSSAWVTRRRKLLELDDSMREIAEKHPEAITTDALEHIAAYPQNIQRAVVGDIAMYINNGAMITWGSVGSKFRAKTQNLDSATFIQKGDCGDCAACANRTGACRDLFGDVEEGKLGNCLDAKCFKRHVADWEKKAIAAVVPDGVEVVHVKYAWAMPSGQKRTKKTPCAYVFIDWKGDVEVKWGESEKQRKADAARRKEDDESARAASAERERLLDEKNDKENEIADSICDSDTETIGREIIKSAKSDKGMVWMVGFAVQTVFRELYDIEAEDMEKVYSLIPEATTTRLKLSAVVVRRAELIQELEKASK